MPEHLVSAKDDETQGQYRKAVGAGFLRQLAQPYRLLRSAHSGPHVDWNALVDDVQRQLEEPMFFFDAEGPELARSANRKDPVHARRNQVFRELLENVLF